MDNYVLTYDPLAAQHLQDQLLAFVKSNRHVIQWGHPFLGTFLLKSNADIRTLGESFDDFFARKTLHLLAPIPANQSQGYLPAHLWDWINQPTASELLRGLGALSSYNALMPKGD